MRIIIGALWLVLFLVLFAFAVNNTAVTDLRFFAGMGIKAPLIALLLAFFIGGFAFGFIALMPAWVRQRVEIRRLRRVAARPVDVAPAATARAASSSGVNLASTDIIQTVARGARATN
jgi:lipopolysaccharide assembly protein A